MPEIYTGRGDEGQTDLMNGDRVAKSSARPNAYGTVDEVNAVVGNAIATMRDLSAETDRHTSRLTAVQNDLHIIQSQLSHPGAEDDDRIPTLDREATSQLEQWIDEYDDELEDLTAFILPGGGTSGAQLHTARSVARRAERATVDLAETDGEQVPLAVLAYLNRLSDFLFKLARRVNKAEGVPEQSPSY